MIANLKTCLLPCCILLMLTMSCSRSPVPPPVETASGSTGDLKNLLVGTWWSDEIVVHIDTIFNSETSVLVQVSKNEWGDKLHLRPIQTIFNPNKTYVSAYCTTEGKIVRVTAGKWTVEKNRLSIHQLFPSDKEMNYRIDMNSGYAQLRSQLDFDGDGKSDDVFYCQMIKVG